MIGTPLPESFFVKNAEHVARALIGVRLLVNGVGGIIVETEAYDAADPASHSFRGPTARNAAMFGPPGHAYIYRIYGLHWCLNVVSAGGRPGSAVLLRALEPTDGIEAMQARRGVQNVRLLCSGPGRLAQALALDGMLDGAPLDAPPFEMTAGAPSEQVLAGPRIGISRGVETPWRFCRTGSCFLSRPGG